MGMKLDDCPFSIKTSWEYHLKENDTVTVGIEEIGILENTVKK